VEKESAKIYDLTLGYNKLLFSPEQQASLIEKYSKQHSMQQQSNITS